MGILKVGIIGCGSIGTIIAKSVKSGKAGNAHIAALYDIDSRALEKLASITGAPVARSIRELVSRSDLVVECASQKAVREYGPYVAGKKDFMVMSVGALLDKKLLSALVDNAGRKGKRIYVPSGAVCGIDGLKGASVGGIESVSLTTRKPPAALGLDSKAERVVFSGSPELAVRKFPTNINVSAVARLSSAKAPVTVKIVADPSVKLNTHEIIAKGKFGRMLCRCENRPSSNPKTSALAAMSAVAVIKRMTQVLVVGT